MKGLVIAAAVMLSIVPAFAQSVADADKLYANRTDLPSAEKAAALWEAAAMRDPHDFESAWKLARACYWLGGHVPMDRRRAELERGVAAGRQAAAVRPDRAEGHFWTAANMGALAESFGLRQGLRYRGAIKDELEAVLRIDPAYQEGSADRALGRWYFKVPGLFGGSREKSVEHLQRSLTYNPNSAASHLFLAHTLRAMSRSAEADAELQKVLDAPLDPEWTPEDLEFKAQARMLLSRAPR
jgi:tetratricopeptide (TPR) repeat protein